MVEDEGFVLARPSTVAAGEGLSLTAAEVYALVHHLNYPELYEKDAAEIDDLARKLSEYTAQFNLKF